MRDRSVKTVVIDQNTVDMLVGSESGKRSIGDICREAFLAYLEEKEKESAPGSCVKASFRLDDETLLRFHTAFPHETFSEVVRHAVVRYAVRWRHYESAT